MKTTMNSHGSGKGMTPALYRNIKLYNQNFDTIFRKENKKKEEQKQRTA